MERERLSSGLPSLATTAFRPNSLAWQHRTQLSHIQDFYNVLNFKIFLQWYFANEINWKKYKQSEK